MQRMSYSVGKAPQVRVWQLAVLAVAAIAVLALYAAASARTAPQAEVVYDRPLVAGHTAPGPQNYAALNNTNNEAPRANLSAGYFDFGSIAPSAVVARDFYLSNDGSAPLVIYEARTTCACTTGEISAAVIPPGKAARVTLTFDAGYHDTRGATIRRGLIMATNDPDRPVVEIWVQASVR